MTHVPVRSVVFVLVRLPNRGRRRISATRWRVAAGGPRLPSRGPLTAPRMGGQAAPVGPSKARGADMPERDAPAVHLMCGRSLERRRGDAMVDTGIGRGALRRILREKRAALCLELIVAPWGCAGTPASDRAIGEPRAMRARVRVPPPRSSDRSPPPRRAGTSRAARLVAIASRHLRRPRMQARGLLHRQEAVERDAVAPAGRQRKRCAAERPGGRPSPNAGQRSRRTCDRPSREPREPTRRGAAARWA